MGAILKGPIIVEYKVYRVSKAYKVISRRTPTLLLVPFYRIYLNLILRIVAFNSNKYTVYFLNNITQINKVDLMAKKPSLTQRVITYCNTIK